MSEDQLDSDYGDFSKKIEYSAPQTKIIPVESITKLEQLKQKKVVSQLPKTSANRSDGKDLYRGLRLFNCVMSILHLGQGIAVVILSKAVTISITTNYLAPNLVLKRGVPKLEQIFDVRISFLIAGFLFISAFAHFMLVLPKIYEWYINNLKQKIQVARWYEYALSSSIMIVAIAILCGMYDLGSLILLFGLNATMNLFGLLMEKHNSDIRSLENQITGHDDGSSLEVNKVRWTGFVFGCVAGVIPWVVISLYFITALSRTNDIFKVPDFIYFIFYSLFVFFNLFALNMFLQYKQVGPWKNYTFGERMYIVLSLVAKSALVWQIFIGALR